MVMTQKAEQLWSGSAIRYYCHFWQYNVGVLHRRSTLCAFLTHSLDKRRKRKDWVAVPPLNETMTLRKTPIARRERPWLIIGRGVPQRRAARLRAYCRRILARLPHASILHQRRFPVLLLSRKSHPHPGHSFTLPRSSAEVKSSIAESATGQSRSVVASPFPHSHENSCATGDNVA